MNSRQIELLKEALILNEVLVLENGKLNESSFKRLLTEAEEVEKKAEEIENVSKGSIGKRDAIGFITALYGGIGAIPGIQQTGISKVIDATLVVKCVYDASQALNAMAALNDIVEEATGKSGLNPALLVPGAQYYVATGDLFDKGDIETIRSLPPEVKAKARQYAISSFQYTRRAIISLLGAIPDLSFTGAVDITGAAAGAALALIKDFTPALIAMIKAVANLSRQFKKLHEYAQADNVLGRALRLLLNFGCIYNLGMTMVALDILEPGAGDQLRQYVGSEGATRSETEKELADLMRQQEKERMDSERKDLDLRKQRRDLDAELEKERQAYLPPEPPQPGGPGVQRTLEESRNINVDRWKILAGLE